MSRGSAATLLLSLLALAGCATESSYLRVTADDQAEVFVTMEPGEPELTYVATTRGAGGDLVWALPPALENQKLFVVVKGPRGAWKYTVFTDRDIALRHPPGTERPAGVGAVEALAPDDPILLHRRLDAAAPGR